MIRRFRRSADSGGKVTGMDRLVLTTVGGKTVNVTATQLAGQERDAAWQHVTAAQPRYAGYEKKTDRLIPVIRLTAS